jgi:chloramphenicol 3-O-phosphotransferase
MVLNGGPGRGTSGIARCLQAVLPDPWLAVGVGMLIQAVPASCTHRMQGIEFAADGVSVGRVSGAGGGVDPRAAADLRPALALGSPTCGHGPTS